MAYQEDQVIGVVASTLRAMDVPVLAEGGNQMRAFRFLLPTGRRKAPDLAFVWRETLFIFEAKIHPGHLFVAGPDGYSDYDSMRFLLSSGESQAILLEEAQRRLRACGRECEKVSLVVTGLIAVGSVASRLDTSDQMEAICVDPQSHTWRIETQGPDRRLSDLL